MWLETPSSMSFSSFEQTFTAEYRVDSALGHSLLNFKRIVASYSETDC